MRVSLLGHFTLLLCSALSEGENKKHHVRHMLSCVCSSGAVGCMSVKHMPGTQIEAFFPEPQTVSTVHCGHTLGSLKLSRTKL